MPRTPDQEALYEASGRVMSDDPLVSFLYRLMRDEMPVGRVDAIVVDVAKIPTTTSFTNGYLARHAQHLADELRRKGGT